MLNTVMTSRCITQMSSDITTGYRSSPVASYLSYLKSKRIISSAKHIAWSGIFLTHSAHVTQTIRSTTMPIHHIPGEDMPQKQTHYPIRYSRTRLCRSQEIPQPSSNKKAGCFLISGFSGVRDAVASILHGNEKDRIWAPHCWKKRTSPSFPSTQYRTIPTL